MSLFFNNSLKIINELNVKGGASADDETTKDDNDLPPEDNNTSDNNDLPPEDNNNDLPPEDGEGSDDNNDLPPEDTDELPEDGEGDGGSDDNNDLPPEDTDELPEDDEGADGGSSDDNDLPPEDSDGSDGGSDDNNDLPPEDNEGDGGSDDNNDLPPEDNDSDDDSNDDDSTDDGDMENFDDDKIKTLSDMEDTIFSSLSPEQKTIKVLELKGTFVTLFNSCDDILEKIELIPKDNGVIDTFEKITDTLIKLKTYIEFYLSKTFDTKSYLENEVVLQKYTTIFNAVKEVFKEISKRK